MGDRQFSPTCKLWGPLLEGMSSSTFSSFFAFISKLPFLRYCFLKCCKLFWVRWLFWSRVLMHHPFQGACFVSPLLLRTSYRKISMFMKRMSSTIGRTCCPCLCPRLENHFECPRSSIHSPSRPSLRCAWKQDLLLLTCLHPQVCYLLSPKLLFCLFISSCGFHSHFFYRP